MQQKSVQHSPGKLSHNPAFSGKKPREKSPPDLDKPSVLW